MCKTFKIGLVEVGQDSPFFVIAGPCVIESEEVCLNIAKRLAQIQENTGIKIIFKASFNKANRTSIHSYRGVELASGLNILNEVRERTGLPVLTDVHEPWQVNMVARFVDCLQIPAFLCRQTNLLLACSETGLSINVKKGQFLSPEEMGSIIEKIEYCGNTSIILTERGTFFGYNRLVNDMTSIPTMKKFGYPVVFDATHSAQLPGILGDKSGGRREMAPILARAGIAAGANGLFVEVHTNPEESKSDAATIMPIDWLEDLMVQCARIQEVIIR